MSSLPPHLFRRWSHSFEDDSGDVRVYRPGEYPFPRARGRAGIELRPDGAFVDWEIGRGDGNQPRTGRWQEESPGRVRVTLDGDNRPPFGLEIVEVTADILKVRRT
jgi:hypothetical protein